MATVRSEIVIDFAANTAAAQAQMDALQKKMTMLNNSMGPGATKQITDYSKTLKTATTLDFNVDTP
jgi:hypothetical protein